MSVPDVPAPILALVPSSRALGLAMIDGALRVREARLHDLRHFTDTDQKLKTVWRIARSAVCDLGAAAIAVEEGRRGCPSNEGTLITKAVIQAAVLAEIPVIRLPIRDAYLAVSGSVRAGDNALVLGERYPVLQARLAEGPRPFRDLEHQRRVRPLLAALAIAHALALGNVATHG